MFKAPFLIFLLGFFLILFSCKNYNRQQKGAEATLLLDIADSLAKSNMDTAYQLYKTVIENPSIQGTSLNVRALHGIGKIYAFEAKYDSAGVTYSQALTISTALNDTALIIKSRLLKGNNYGETQRFTDSEEEYTEGLKLAKAYKSLNLQNSFNINLGRLKMYSADYKAAIVNFTEGVRLAKLANEPYKEGFALEGIAQIMDITGDFAEAIRYNKLALNMMVKTGYENDVARVLLNMGLYYYNAKQLDSALYFLESSDLLNKKLNNVRQQIQVMYNKGLIKLNQKKFGEAENIISETYVLCVKNNYIDGQAFSLSALAVFYEKTGNPEKALQIIDKSVQLIVENRLSHKLIDVYKQRHSILAGMGRYQDAYKSSLQLIKLNDSLIPLDKQQELQVLKIRFETRIKENEIARLTENVAVKAYANRVQRFSIAVLIVLLLITISLSVYIFRLYKLRNAAYSALTRIYRDQMPVSSHVSENQYAENDISSGVFALPIYRRSKIQGLENDKAGPEIIVSGEPQPENTITILTSILINQKLYLDPGLTADKLASATGLSRQKLAKAIKEEFGGSFFQLLNKYRSEHAIELMHSQSNRNLKIEYIGYHSGFPSRATFYNSFTHYTGLPPAVYRDALFSDDNMENG